MDVAKIAFYSWTLTGAGETELFTLNLASPNLTDKYIIKAVSGLDASDVLQRRLTAKAQSYYLNNPLVLPKNRQVAFLLKINPQYGSNDTVESLRDDLYIKLLSLDSSGLIRIRFIDSSNAYVGSLIGSVARFEAAIFNSSSDVQITFICEQPFIQNDTITDAAAVSTVTDGVVSWNVPKGNAPSPLTVFLGINLNISNSVVRVTCNGKYFILNNITINNNAIYISNDHYVHQTDAGGNINLLDKVDYASVWPMAYPGDNELSVYISASPSSKIGSGISLSTLEYNNRWWGI